ncbi:DNA processing protein DprA [Thermosipho affectus]|uniref:DNA processing protein DprA n=1 Tax=Thermosipho affectus TaxID=660294 RepID=A0ABX3IGU4_9BACT|nr:DNA-processing protein DprA [Thermosipho affectus]ONN26524.1 DNA processing protein DprA [Thermosipho affectus]
MKKNLKIVVWHFSGYRLDEIERKLSKDEDGEKNDLYFKLEDWLSKTENFVVTYFDEYYPENLKNVWNPPVVLFGKGKKSLLLKRSFSIVGARKASSYGRKVTCEFSKKLSNYFVIVSGMAMGIDSIAHNCAKETIAILGSGVDVCYPEKNRGIYERLILDGCVISEYLPWKSPKKEYFRERNRIIAGISEGTLIVEGKLKSGTMITARFALEFGKDVFCIPGNIYNENAQGPNYLIKNGAFLATGPDDILDYYILRGVLYDNC